MSWQRFPATPPHIFQIPAAFLEEYEQQQLAVFKSNRLRLQNSKLETNVRNTHHLTHLLSAGQQTALQVMPQKACELVTKPFEGMLRDVEIGEMTIEEIERQTMAMIARKAGELVREAVRIVKQTTAAMDAKNRTMASKKEGAAIVSASNFEEGAAVERVVVKAKETKKKIGAKQRRDDEKKKKTATAKK